MKDEITVTVIAAGFERAGAADVFESSVIPGSGQAEAVAAEHKEADTASAAADDGSHGKFSSRIDSPTFLQR